MLPGTVRAIAVITVLVAARHGLLATAPSSVSLSSAAGSAVLGGVVTLKATVSPSTATGKVTFYDGVLIIGTSTISAGQAILTTSLLASGQHAMKADYAGDVNFAPGTSAAFRFSVTSLPQNGLGTPSAFGAGTNAASVALGDFNGDGKPDLAVAGIDNYVRILLGNGDGTFGAAASAAMTATPISMIIAADFNGDGKMDLAVANPNGTPTGTVGVLLGNGDGTFQPAVSYADGDNSGFLLTADLNGDGIPDLAVLNNEPAGLVSILLGNGDGTFRAAVPYAVGAAPISGAIADFNGDGRADMVVVNYDGNNVSVLLGLGDGTFGPATALGTGANPSTVVTGDFNGDGNEDFVILNGGGVDYYGPGNVNFGGSDGISAFLGKGDGTFSSTMAWPAGPALWFPSAVAAGDFNGDGKIDFAVNAGVHDTIDIMFGNGDGTFQAAEYYSTSGFTQGAIAGDYNGDGITDLLVFSGDLASSIGVMLGLPSGASPQTISFPALRDEPFSALYAALSATASSGLPVTLTINTPSVCFPYDGFADFISVGTCSVTASQQGNSTYAPAGQVTRTFMVDPGQQTIEFGALSNQALGSSPTLNVTASSLLEVTLTSNTTSVCTVSGSGVTLVAAGSCSITASQPGNADYAAATPVTQTFSVTPASQSISFDAVPNQIFGISPFPIGAESSSLLPVTFASTTPTVCKNSDDLVMLLNAGMCSITASQAGNASYNAATSALSFIVSLAKPSGSFAPAPGSPFVLGPTGSVATGDFNGDGVPDLAVVAYGGVVVLLGDGSGNFGAIPGSPFVPGTNTVYIAVGDFNGDGIQDIATTNFDVVSFASRVTVLLGDGSGKFMEAPGSPYTVGPSPTSLVVGDFNGDGIQDLATASSMLGTLTVLLGDGSGRFAATAQFAVLEDPFALTIGDFNGDGIQDLAVTTFPGLTVLLGNGSGGFTAAAGSPFAVGSLGSLVVGDFNGDGIQDLAAANGNGNDVAVLLGNGSGGFTAAAGSPFAVGDGLAFLVVGDFNEDGIQDLATANSASNDVTVLLGNGAGGFAAAPTSPLAAGKIPSSVAVGDFNGDGIEDLAIANDSDGTVTVLLGVVVGSTSQTITFGPLSDVAYGVPPFTISATASSGLVVSLASTTPQVCTVEGDTVSIVNGGPCSIVASQAGNATYAAGATVTETFTVTQNSQTITFAPLTDQTLGSSPLPLSATASSGYDVSFVSNTGAVCGVSGATVVLIAVGTCSITADQYGGLAWAAATPVTQTFTVSAAGIQPAAGFLDLYGAPALTFNGSMGFPDAGGLLIGPPGVTQDLNGNVYVLGLDSAGGVHLNSYSFANSAWNGWQYSGGILDTTSGLTAAVDPNGVVWFTGRDIGNRFWINSWNGAAFGGWILVAGGIFASDSVPQIAITADGTVWIVGKDIGGRIWSNSYAPTSQTFTGWADRQAVMIGQPSVTAGQDGMVYVAVRSVALNSPVYITQIPAQNAPTANTWLNGGGLIDTDPQITSQDGTVYLMAEAGGNTVYLLTFAESTQTFGTWNSTNGVLNDATIAAATGNVYIAGRDSSDRIYWYSLAGNSWFLAGGAGISSTVLTGGK